MFRMFNCLKERYSQVHNKRVGGQIKLGWGLQGFWKMIKQGGQNSKRGGGEWYKI